MKNYFQNFSKHLKLIHLFFFNLHNIFSIVFQTSLFISSKFSFYFFKIFIFIFSQITTR